MKPTATFYLFVILTSLLLPATQAAPWGSIGINSFGIINNLWFDGPRAEGFNLITCSASPLSDQLGPEKGNLTVYFLDVGQGDSILVQFGDKNMLVDGGVKDMGPRVVSCLESLGVEQIDVMVLTHPHEDHVGGLISVLKSFEVKKVLDSGQAHTTRTYENFLNLVDRKDIPYQAAEEGMSIDLAPEVAIEVLSPPSGGLGDDLNENSVVLKVTYGKVSFLLTGDAGFEAEDHMISSGADLKSDILKVGHHGSRTSSSDDFLYAVSPSVSVISVGTDNPYGHPSKEALRRLESSGSEVLRTDLDGNATVTTDGVSFFVRSGSLMKATDTRSSVQDSDSSGLSAPTSASDVTSDSDSHNSVSISSVQFNSPGDDRDNLNGEWVKITNSGSDQVQLKGWTLSDDGERNCYTFPDFVLYPGSAVTVFTGTGYDTDEDLYMGKSAPVWNNDGDSATLKDANGNVVDSMSG